MKIAVIDHIINPGGGARVVRSLLAALKRVRPDLDITFYGSEHGIKREGIKKALAFAWACADSELSSGNAFCMLIFTY